MPSVMISGWTLNTPTPMPLAIPAMRAASRASAMAGPDPIWPVWVAMMNAAIEATVPTDRSMPPVSIASVWAAPRIASGTAARIVEPTQLWVTTPGWASCIRTTSSTRSAVSGMSGRSRRSRRVRSATPTRPPPLGTMPACAVTTVPAAW